jgi:hypothetical protein
MAKQAYVYSGTDWVPLASEVTNLSDYQTKAATGLVLLNTTSFSGVTSVSLPADTFTSTYENYRIIYKFTPVNSDVVFARLRAAGVDATAAQYNPATFFVRTGNRRRN